MRNLRHSSLEKDVKNLQSKFQFEILYSNLDINVQNIKVIKMVLRSHFVKTKANHRITYMIRWRKNCLLFDI